MMIFITIILILINIFLCIINAIIFNEEKTNMSLALCISNAFAAQLFIMLLIIKTTEGA